MTLRKKIWVGMAAVWIAGVACGVAWAQRVDVASLPFSTARPAGNTLYISGRIPTSDGSVVTGSIADQTRLTMDNIGAILKENGYTFADVVNVTVYLSDMKHYDEMNAAYREYFPDGKYPARACVGGLQLALGADMEISAVAYK
jgi:2-iminobutanoate/2-iminopropanoate deaminase